MSIFFEICERCAGNGKVDKHYEIRSHVNGRVIADTYKREDCPVCKGTGRVDDWPVLRFSYYAVIVIAIILFVLVPAFRIMADA